MDVTAEDVMHEARARLDRYILAADQKASILLTAQLAFVGLIINVTGSSWKQINQISQNIFFVGMICAVVSVVLSGLVVYPRTNSATNGHLFWQDILTNEREGYKSEMFELSRSEAAEEMLNENYALAAIADKKHNYLRYSLLTTAAMIMVLIVAAIAHSAG